jgi:hypothetical protein
VIVELAAEACHVHRLAHEQTAYVDAGRRVDEDLRGA